jgi:hypothetical protein
MIDVVMIGDVSNVLLSPSVHGWCGNEERRPDRRRIVGMWLAGKLGSIFVGSTR